MGIEEATFYKVECDRCELTLPPQPTYTIAILVSRELSWVVDNAYDLDLTRAFCPDCWGGMWEEAGRKEMEKIKKEDGKGGGGEWDTRQPPVIG